MRMQRRRLSLILIILLSGSSGSFAQNLERGRIFTLHVVEVELKRNVTEESFIEFMTSEFLPVWEKHYEGIEAVFLQGIRGEHGTKFAWMNYYASEDLLKSYYPEAGKQSKKAKSAEAKMKDIMKKMNSFGRLRYIEYTTWKVE